MAYPNNDSSDSRLLFLLVEDSKPDARLVQLWLERSELRPQVEVVEDGEAALEFLHRRPPYDQVRRPDLVLLDLNLPGLNGLDVLSEIRAVPELSDLPVVILTTSALATDVHRAHELKVDRYLSKPTDAEGFQELVDLVRQFMEER